jgi:hypothetical protein
MLLLVKANRSVIQEYAYRVSIHLTVATLHYVKANRSVIQEYALTVATLHYAKR